MKSKKKHAHANTYMRKLGFRLTYFLTELGAMCKGCFQ